MGDTLVFSGVSIYTLGIIVVFSFLWGSFVFYKKAIESHHEVDVVLDMIVLSAFWAFIIGRVGFVLMNVPSFYNRWTRIFLLVNYPGIERWGVILGLLVGLALMVRKKKVRYLDLLDFSVLGFLSASALFWSFINLMSFYWQNTILSIYYFVTFLIFWKLEKSYRLISWYRGTKTFARSGFISGFGLFVLGIGFIIEKLLFNKFTAGSLVWGVLLALCGLVLVYIRSGRLLVDDIKLLKIWNKKIKK